ncbi:MAG: hypothetical protein ACRC01_08845 [Deefgea sp.]
MMALTYAQAAELVVRMRPKQAESDSSHDYFIGLAQLALNKTEAEYGAARIELTTVQMNQSRALVELAEGNFIDLDWAGTDSSRENTLLPIRIPLEGGLLGFRIPVIRKDSLAKFEKINTAQELSQFTAIQGINWPDTAILEAAGLRVEKTTQFAFMYPKLKNKRADYFPRGLNEVYAEVDSLKDDTLIAYDKLILVYRLPMYFFTSKNNPQLAQRIEKGLRLAIKDGSFLHYMQNSPVMSKVFPLSKYKNARKIYLNNPSPPSEVPLNESTLWLNLD